MPFHLETRCLGPNALGIDALSIASQNQRFVFSTATGAFFEADILNADGSVAGGTVYTLAGVNALRERPALDAPTLP